MPHLGIRIDNKTRLQIERYCTNHEMTTTQFIKESLYEKLHGDLLFDDSDWKTNAAALFGITVGQLAHAISNSTSVSEFFGRINAKTDIMELFPISSRDDTGVQITRNNQTFIVKIAKSGSRLDMIKKLLSMIEEKVCSLDEEFYDNILDKGEDSNQNKCDPLVDTLRDDAVY